MVSSDFGKLDVMRHLISGADCAIAGEATAAAAVAPAADTFKKSRRFTQSLLLGRIRYPLGHFFQRRDCGRRRKARWRLGFNTEARRSKRDEGMTSRLKRKSNRREPVQA